MHLRPWRTLSLLACSIALPAQVFTETFEYPDGNVIPGWTARRGEWQVSSGRVATTTSATWCYLTKDGVTAATGVLEAELFFSPFGVQFAGLAMRHNGGAEDTDLLMVKLQSSGGTGSTAGFDRLYMYERPLPLSTWFSSLARVTRQARVRMITLASEFWVELDGDRDGVYETALPRRPITRVFNPGLLGVSGFEFCELDNLKFYDATLTPEPLAVPRVGASYRLQLDTPTANTLWFGILSLGRAGLDVGLDRKVPLTLDDLFTISLGSAPALGLIGTTDANGNASPSLPIPPQTSLVGFNMFMAAVTIDQTKPFWVGHISNEQHIRIRP
jgi:hypothetical protein